MTACRHTHKTNTKNAALKMKWSEAGSIDAKQKNETKFYTHQTHYEQYFCVFFFVGLPNSQGVFIRLTRRQFVGVCVHCCWTLILFIYLLVCFVAESRMSSKYPHDKRMCCNTVRSTVCHLRIFVPVSQSISVRVWTFSSFLCLHT